MERSAKYGMNFKGLKATIEQQDNGAGILHKVTQFTIDQSMLIYKALIPFSANTRPRETRYPPTLAQRGS